MSGGKIKAASVVDKEKLQVELQDLRRMREKVIEERKQFDLELKGLNVQVQKKVSSEVKIFSGSCSFRKNSLMSYLVPLIDCC